MFLLYLATKEMKQQTIYTNTRPLKPTHIHTDIIHRVLCMLDKGFTFGLTITIENYLQIKPKRMRWL